jgi:hypothetical protein
MKVSKIDLKTEGYIEQLITSPEFIDPIQTIRGLSGIPKAGFDISLFDKLVIANKHPRIPKQIKKVDIFVKLINNLLLKYGFSHEWFDFFSDYVLFNFIGDTRFKRQIFLLNLGHKNKKSDEHMTLLKESIIQNPIAILLPPFVSQRDIYDFISSNWQKIEGMKKKYNKKIIKISSIRKKNERVKRRNQLIYKNRSLRKKDLTAIVFDKFGDTMDYTYLSKIIRSEKRKRNASR